MFGEPNNVLTQCVHPIDFRYQILPKGSDGTNRRTAFQPWRSYLSLPSAKA